MNNLIYSRTGNALQIYDNFMEYTKMGAVFTESHFLYFTCPYCGKHELIVAYDQELGHIDDKQNL